MGLFLMAFALYAHERSLHLIKKTTPEVAAASPTEVNESRVFTSKLEHLYSDLSQEPLFRRPQDGLKLIRERWAVVIQWSGDDVYSDGEFAMRESWYSVLDQVSELIQKKAVLVEVVGYADEGSLKERKATDYGASDYAFSFARAEWLSRYFERKGNLKLHGIFTLKGMGAVPHGKKIELSLTLP